MRISTDRPITRSAGGQRKLAIENYVAARRAADLAHEEMKKREAELVAVLAEQQLKSGSVEMEGVRYTTTVTSRTTITIDEPGLKKALSAKVFNKLTKSVLDRAKLEDAVTQGEVDPLIVAQYSTPQTGATSIRLIKKEASAEEESPATQSETARATA